MTITVRPAADPDLPRLTSWLLALFAHLTMSRDPYFKGAVLRPEDAEAAMARGMANGDLVLIAELAGRPVGYLLAATEPPFVRESPIEKVGHIRHCYVEPEARHRGVARRLAEEVERRLRRQGIRYIQLNHHVANDLAATAWERLGYRPLRVTLRKDLGPAV